LSYASISLAAYPEYDAQLVALRPRRSFAACSLSLLLLLLWALRRAARRSWPTMEPSHCTNTNNNNEKEGGGVGTSKKKHKQRRRPTSSSSSSSEVGGSEPRASCRSPRLAASSPSLIVILDLLHDPMMRWRSRQRFDIVECSQPFNEGERRVAARYLALSVALVLHPRCTVASVVEGFIREIMLLLMMIKRITR